MRLLYAVWSGSALFAYAILSEFSMYKILGHLPQIGETTTDMFYFSSQTFVLGSNFQSLHK